MKSVMKHSFSQVPNVNVPRSTFNRSHGLKTSFDADYLVPILVDDIVPGDTYNVQCHTFARLATPLFPLMDNLYLETFFFFIPYRLVWENWDKFHGAQDNPADSIDKTIPYATSLTPTEGTLWDYFGLPIGTQIDNVSILPARAYHQVFNHWFRDENLTNEAVVDIADGTDAATSYVLLKRAKRHDYFTSCLPWPQKGDAVDLPLGTSANVLTSASDLVTGAADPIIWELDGGGKPGTSGHLGARSTTGIGFYTASAETTSDNVYPSNLYADLSTATAATVNDLRLAYQTQQLLERDARAGTRYNEMIKAHFGVTVPDYRVQRPEFLGGGSSPINITPVAQTTYQGTATDEDAKGALAGYGTVSGKHGFQKSFTEHGILLGLVNVRGDITYSQGVERYWTKSTRYDFYYPVLSQIGEQSVLNREIYHQNTGADDNVFGYQERYAEMRYKPSRITGLMRPDATGSLAAWHLTEEFSSLPTLGNTFIESNTGTPLDRAIAVSTEPHFIADFYFDMKCARPMPLYGTPVSLGRF